MTHGKEVGTATHGDIATMTALGAGVMTALGVGAIIIHQRLKERKQERFDALHADRMYETEMRFKSEWRERQGAEAITGKLATMLLFE